MRNSQKVTAVFSGEGGSSEGDFHEAMNIASVWKLPVLFCIEHNGYGLSTPSVEQLANQSFADIWLPQHVQSQQKVRRIEEHLSIETALTST